MITPSVRVAFLIFRRHISIWNFGQAFHRWIHSWCFKGKAKKQATKCQVGSLRGRVDVKRREKKQKTEKADWWGRTTAFAMGCWCNAAFKREEGQNGIEFGLHYLHEMVRAILGNWEEERDTSSTALDARSCPYDFTRKTMVLLSSVSSLFHDCMQSRPKQKVNTHKFTRIIMSITLIHPRM